MENFGELQLAADGRCWPLTKHAHCRLPGAGQLQYLQLSYELTFSLLPLMRLPATQL